MKPAYLLSLFVFLACLSLSAQEQYPIKVSLGVNASGISQNGGSASPLPGVQVGLGTEYPLDNSLYLAPSLWLSQGGQVFRNSNSRSGIRNSYLQLSTDAGFEYKLDTVSSFKVEAGPTFNVWARGVQFNNFSGDTQRNKFDIGDNEAANRVFVSGSFDLSYARQIGALELSAGLRLDLGLTPIESFDDGSGEKTKLRTRSLSLVGAVNLAPEDWGLGFKSDSLPEYGFQLEDLIVSTPYEDALGSFKKARKLVDDAYSGNDSVILPPELGQQALEELERTKKLLEDGETAWEEGDDDGIGPETAKLLRRYIEELTTRAQTMADSTWIVEVLEEEIGDDPRDTPPPTIYGEEVDPPWITIAGAMAPSQAVWQDDRYFDDKPTKQLSQKAPDRWHAELDMVANRWTAVFGLKNDRHSIYLSGKSTYSQSVPVRCRLKLIQGGSETIIWTQSKSKFSIPLAGSEGPERSWSMYLYEKESAPVPRTFKMQPGAYTLELELLRDDGTETGLKISTYGNVVSTTMPKVHIVPVLLTSDWTTAQAKELGDRARSIAKDCESEFYRYFPVPVGGVDVRAEAIQYLGFQELGAVDRLISLLPLTDTQEEVRKDRLIAKLTQRFATTAQLGGAGRVVVIINESDFARVYRNHVGIGGFAPHAKVQIMKMDNHATTVAHELIHSFPYLWSRSNMISECGFSYHNADDQDYAEGVEVYSYGSYYRDRRDAIMGSVSILAFITQCSYWHLIQQFQQENDPELFLVRGFLAQESGNYYGVLSPTYEFEGIEGLSTGAILDEGWGIVLKDQAGQVLASYPFEVVWQDPEEAEPRALVPFNHRIDRLPGTASLELVGPGGVKATQTISAHSPVLSILSPRAGRIIENGSQGVEVTWEASDADGDPLQYWVQYSLDEGENWIPLADEIQATSLVLPPFGRAKRVKLRVYATDGVLTDWEEVEFGLVP